MKVEWRLVCNAADSDPLHRAHVYSASPRVTADLEAREEFLRSRDNDGSMAMPGNFGCVPWRLECREVGDWVNPDAPLEGQEALW